MYMAQMYCYGWDYGCVGITGIVGCIGCVFVGSQALYAIHIPPNDPEKNKNAGRIFAEFVLVPEKKAEEGELFVFVNGDNRPSAEEEAQAIRKILNKPTTTVYRIMNNLDRTDEPGRNAVTVLVERKATVVMKYKYVPDAQWKGGGKGKSAIYDARYESTFGAPTVPKAAALMDGWHPVDETNCKVKVVR